MKTSLQNLKKRVLASTIAIAAFTGINAQCATSTNITNQGSGNISLMNQSTYSGGWDSYVSISFGDGASGYGTGTNFSSTHQYSSNGTYLVISDLFAYDPMDSSMNCTHTDYDTVIVNDIAPSGCNLQASVNVYSTFGNNAVISGSVNNSFTYSYLTIDGAFFPNTDSMSYSFPAAGSYSVCYYVEDSTQATYCYDSTCIIYTINGGAPQCNANFYLWEDSTNVGQWYAINYASGTGPLTYTWDFGDGTSSNLAYPSHTYAVQGNYIICLTISDANGCTSSSCDSSAAFRISQQQSVNSMIGSLTVSAPVGVKENLSVLAETKMSPNPMTEISAITFNSSLSANGKIEIVNILGAVVLSENVVITKGNNDFKLNTSTLNNGVYYVNIVAENKVLTTVKAIK